MKINAVLITPSIFLNIDLKPFLLMIFETKAFHTSIY